MLNVLAEVETRIHELLADEAGWQSLYIDYHPPVVERLWRQEGDHRILLHRIHPCKASEALWHPHPWPSAMVIVRGSYEMAIGQGIWRPKAAMTAVLPAGTRYEMADPYGWHYVRPIDGPSLTLMVIGKPWREAISTGVETGPLKPLSPEQRATLFEDFRSVLVR